MDQWVKGLILNFRDSESICPTVHGGTAGVQISENAEV